LLTRPRWRWHRADFRPQGVRTVPAPAPTNADLLASYKAAKTSPEVAAVQIEPSALANRAGAIKSEATAEWLDPDLAPRTFGIVNKLENPPTSGPVTMANVDSARRRLGDVIGDGGEDAAAAMIAKRHLDDMLAKPLPASDVIAGDPQLGHQIMMSGRGDYTAMKGSEALDKRIAAGELETGATYSGENLQNKLRQKVVGFLKSPDSRGLAAADRAELEAFATGSTGENIARFFGRKLGNQFTVGAASTIGALLGGPAGLRRVSASAPLAMVCGP
jgi:hypothetical protein